MKLHVYLALVSRIGKCNCCEFANEFATDSRLFSIGVLQRLNARVRLFRKKKLEK